MGHFEECMTEVLKNSFHYIKWRKYDFSAAIMMLKQHVQMYVSPSGSVKQTTYQNVWARIDSVINC